MRSVRDAKQKEGHLGQKSKGRKEKKNTKSKAKKGGKARKGKKGGKLRKGKNGGKARKGKKGGKEGNGRNKVRNAAKGKQSKGRKGENKNRQGNDVAEDDGKIIDLLFCKKRVNCFEVSIQIYNIPYTL